MMKTFSKLIFGSALLITGAAHAAGTDYFESFDGNPLSPSASLGGNFASVTFNSGSDSANQGKIGSVTGSTDGFAQLGGTSTMTLTFELDSAVNSFSLSFYASTLLTNLQPSELSRPSVTLSNAFASQTLTSNVHIAQGIENPGGNLSGGSAGTAYSFVFAAPVAMPVNTAVMGTAPLNPQSAPWAAGLYSMVFTNVPSESGIRIDDIVLFGNAPAVTPVPEPFTVALALAGLGIVTIGARASRKA